ncbi:MAG: hypothetical protein KDE25_03580 [Novosphingobium sp.]|nr:hypothetical protein [Novosphingobium sp.]
MIYPGYSACKRLAAPANVMALAAVLAATLPCSAFASDKPNIAALPAPVPPNPYLAPSANPVAHRNSAQQDSSLVRGPEGPSREVAEDELDWFFTGPGHYGAFTGITTQDGRRIDWTSGRDAIIKYDGIGHKLLAAYPIGKGPFYTPQSADAAIAAVFSAPPEARPMEALKLAAQIQRGLVGIYSLVDRDGNFVVGGAKGVTIYGNAEAGNPDSPIKVIRTWQAPPVAGDLVGINMTYDGWLVFVSEGGDVLVVSRDFTKYHSVRLRHAENAEAYAEHVKKNSSPGYTWVRNNYPVDKDGGIYVVSAGYVHKVVWTGEKLSLDPKDGAWCEPYPDSSGNGTGATPALMGFGPNEDHLLTFTDGDRVMNVVAYWRDGIPKDWKQIPGSPSRRMAGMARADMGNPNATDVQTEQATIVSGYGALVVNNAPATVPAGFPPVGKRVLVGLLGADPRFTPHGLQKFEWDPARRELKLAWTSKVASPNVVPFISAASNMVYTMGVRDGQWTLEGINWSTGESSFHRVLPGEKYNGFYSGLIQTDEGDIIFGTPFGRARIRR